MERFQRFKNQLWVYHFSFPKESKKAGIKSFIPASLDCISHLFISFHKLWIASDVTAGNVIS
jgi:hypothetical protein